MVGINDPRERLKRWSPAIFLTAGSLLSVTAAIEALGAFTRVAAEAGSLLFVQSLAGFGGIVLAFVGLVGLSIRLADRSPRLAKLGVGLVALPTLFVLSLLLCVTVVSVLGLPSPTKVLPALEVVTGTVFLMAAAGITALSIAGLRTDARSRTTGGALTAFAAAWFLLSVAMLRCGHVSDLTNIIATGLIAAATVGLGDTLPGRDGSGRLREADT
jgi:hypothetical protein